MGCAPSKNTSTVHPTISSNDSIILPEQVTYYNRHLQNRTILVQELPDPPSSTPEPTETTETTEQIFEPSAAAELQVKLQGHISKSSKQSKRPKLQRQSNISDDEEEIQSSSCDQNCGESNSNVDSSYLEENCTPTNSSSNQWTSDVPDGQLQWSRPSWVVEKAFQRSNPTLRLYGTDSQIEFFKMLDKKIEEGPDFHEESDSDERT